MNNPSPRPGLPAIHRSLCLAGAAGVAAVWLTPDPDELPRGLSDWPEWWARTQAPSAAMALVRMLGSVAAIATLGLAAVAVLASVGPFPGPARVWRRLAPAPLHRLLAASVLIGVAADPVAPASAAEHDTVPPPVLTDLGLAETPSGLVPVLIDLGPTDIDPPAGATVPVTTVTDGDIATRPAPTEDRWVVESGDHLWHVAEETLMDRGTTPSTPEIERYWRRLIDINRAVIGDDPDLILPGMELVLPE
jgi:hypothetical protein